MEKKNEKFTINAEEGWPGREALKGWTVEGREGISGARSYSIVQPWEREV